MPIVDKRITCCNGPEPCLSSHATGRCYSPMACGAFGYCRDRNIKLGLPSDEIAKQWRADAAKTKREVGL